MTAERKLRVGILFGGQSGEHEISLLSARSIMQAIDPQKYEVVPLGITKDGRWLTRGNPYKQLVAASALWNKAALPVDTDETSEDAGLGTAELALSQGAAGSGAALAGLDVIFPVLHGPHGEDGTVQGLLELAGVPYVGTGVVGSAVGMDKAVFKALMRAHGLPVVPWQIVLRSRWAQAREAVLDEVEAGLPYPLFVKPANLGSSVGVSKARTRSELARALDEAAVYDRRLIVEQGVASAREIEVSVLGNDAPEASVPGEVVPGREFYDYAAKYIEDSSQLLIPAPLDEATARRARELAVAAFLATDCAGMARVDFLLDRADGQLYINELNTIPGFTAISMYPKLWEASGLPYAALIDRLIELALARDVERKGTRHTYQPPVGE